MTRPTTRCRGPRSGLYLDAREDKIARADLQLSQAVALYARHAYSGRVTPSEISSNLNYKLNPPAAATSSSSSPARSDPVATLEAYHPPQTEFAALRAELGAAPGRGGGRDASGRRRGRTPQAGDERSARAGDPRAAAARLRHAIDPELYDEILVDAVKGFQASAGLRSDGIIGKNTVLAMNGRGADPVETILVNMERWRWMPRYLGDFYVRVNIPNYNLDVYRDGEVFYTTRIVVGKVGSQTPIFSDEIENIVVNPYWNVPASIVRNEMMPSIRNGSGLRGYQVYAKVRGRYPRRRSRAASTGGRSMPVRSRSSSRRARGMRSARSSSSFRTSTMSTCTTRRRRACSSARSAPSATAACG